MKDEPGLDIFKTEASFFIYVNFSQLTKSLATFREVMEANNIIFAYGESFVQDGDNFARINIGIGRAKLERFISRFKLAINEVRKITNNQKSLSSCEK